MEHATEDAPATDFCASGGSDAGCDAAHTCSSTHNGPLCGCFYSVNNNGFDPHDSVAARAFLNDEAWLDESRCLATADLDTFISDVGIHRAHHSQVQHIVFGAGNLGSSNTAPIVVASHHHVRIEGLLRVPGNLLKKGVGANILLRHPQQHTSLLVQLQAKPTHSRYSGE